MQPCFVPPVGDKAGKTRLLFLNSESFEIPTEQIDSHGDSSVLRNCIPLLDIWTMDGEGRLLSLFEDNALRNFLSEGRAAASP